MWATIMFSGFAVLSAALSTAAACIGLRRSSTGEQRDFAWKLFRAAWASGTSGTVTVTAGLVRLHQLGLLDWAGPPP